MSLDGHLLHVLSSGCECQNQQRCIAANVASTHASCNRHAKDLKGTIFIVKWLQVGSAKSLPSMTQAFQLRSLHVSCTALRFVREPQLLDPICDRHRINTA